MNWLATCAILGTLLAVVIVGATRWKRSRPFRVWTVRFAMAVIPVFLLVVGAEVVLRISGYGFDPRFFVPAKDGQLRANERFAWRFMPSALARSPAPERISAQKPAGTRRIFLLGSSAAMGYPSPAFGVGRMLEVMLRAAHPEVRVEVINTAMTAINSHVVAEIARECRDYDPDMFIVYTGNNEVVGPYGPGTVLSAVRSNRFFIRAGIALSSLRVGQWLSRATAGSAPIRWGGMEMFAGNAIAPGDPRLAGVVENYRANLASICSSATRVVLCTVPVNLRDLAPFGSPEAAQEFARGRELMDAGKTAEAGGHFAAARDMDAVRFRADSALVSAARKVVADESRSSVVLADLAAGLEQRSGGAPGSDFFLEHVHLNFAGNYTAALIILDAIEPGAAARAPDAGTVAGALAFTPWDAAAGAKMVLDLLARPPFGPQHENLRAAARETFAEAQSRKRTPDAIGAARAVYEHALRERPDDFWIMSNFASFLAQTGDAIAEIASRRRVVELRPEIASAKVELARVLLKSGRESESRELLANAEKQMPGNPSLMKSIADVFLENKHFDAAEKQLRAALAIQPEYPSAQVNLAAIAQSKGDFAEAEKLLLAALAVQNDAAARANLGNLLVRQRRTAEAVPHFESVTKLEPREISAWQNLGAALLSIGKLPEAETAFRKVMDLDARDVRAEFSLGQVSAQRGDWLDAELRWRAVLSRQSGFLPAARELAWIFATAPDDSVRRADEAISIAERLNRAAPDAPAVLDALAAAYANVGRFDEATVNATRAAELAEKSSDPTAADIRERIAMYRAGRPFRSKR
jgi:tetratricopeptide (TPR) repeat protein